MAVGMAELRVYTNKACTRELTTDVNENYILDVNVLSANTLNPHTIILWVKNTGDHTAYDSSITVDSSTLPGVTITTSISTSNMLAGEVRKAVVNCPITQGQTGTYSISLNLYYDSV